MSYCADDIVVTAGTLMDKAAIREYYADYFSSSLYINKK